ncbi:glycosyltransferase family 4 protein [Peribacillus sp. TH14]|nr:glycosyltransferase family 4 protein [Peribacillus sp. TH14]
MIYKILGIHKKVTYTSTSLLDKKDINNVFGGNIKVWTAGNIVNNEVELKGISREKKIGELKIVTLSRISKIKNLDYSLNILKKIAESYELPNEISFDIYGPIEDGEYWEECSSLINKIGNTISINYKGPIDYNDVINVLSKYHIFLLPTQGENFGHVIQEAFLAGCPVIISNKTPWVGLKDLQVGFDIPLEQQDDYFSAIKHYLLMDSNDYKNASLKAIEYGMEKVRNQGSIMEHIEMFDNEMNK